SKIILRLGSIAIEGFELTDEELIDIAPVIHRRGSKRSRCNRLKKLFEALLRGVRHRYVAWRVVVSHAVVGTALDIGVSTQRIHASPRTSHISENQLQHCRGMDQLHGKAVMRPSQCVDNGSRPIKSVG